MGFFTPNHKKIKELCKWCFERVPPKIDIIPISSHELLIANADAVTIDCHNEPPAHRQSCQYCVINYPCFCTALATSYTIGSISIGLRIHSCVPPGEPFTLTTPVNMAMLQYMMSDEYLTNITTMPLIEARKAWDNLLLQVDDSRYKQALTKNFQFSKRP